MSNTQAEVPPSIPDSGTRKEVAKCPNCYAVYRYRHVCKGTLVDRLRAELDAALRATEGRGPGTEWTDSHRLDFLETEAMDHPLVLHNREQGLWGDFRGFGLGHGNTLRQMIDGYVQYIRTTDSNARTEPAIQEAK